MQTLKIGLALSQSWKTLKGSRWSIWLVIIAMVGVRIASMIFIIMPAAIIMHHVSGVDFNTAMDTLIAPPLHQLRHLGAPAMKPSVIASVVNFLCAALFAPFFAGLVMIGVKRARGEAVNAGSGFHYFHRWLPLIYVVFFADLFMYFYRLTMYYPNLHPIFFLLLLFSVLLLFFLLPFYSMWIPAVADKKISAFTAWKNIFMPVLRNWFRILLLWLSLLGILIGIFIAAAIVAALLIALPAYFITHSVYMDTAEVGILVAFGAIVLILVGISFIPYSFLIRGQIYHQLMDAENTNPIV